MFEVAKLLWDIFMLRRSIRDGDMTAATWGAAILFLLALLVIVLPGLLYYNSHPDAPATPLLFVTIGLVAVWFIVVMWFSLAWQKAANAKRAAADAAKEPKPG